MGYSQDVLSTLDIYAEIRPVITTLLAEFVKKGTYRNIDRGRKYFEVYTSKYHPQEFLHWTGCTQQGLEESWLISSAKEAVGLPTGYRSTCESFLGKVVQKLIALGWLPRVQFQSFGLFNLGPAWHWCGESPDGPGGGPKAGDFFETGQVAMLHGKKVLAARHVGVIYSINGADWVTIEGGLGGHNSGYDAVGRAEGAPPLKMAGWLNVEEYFLGLAQPSANQAKQAAAAK